MIVEAFGKPEGMVSENKIVSRSARVHCLQLPGSDKAPIGAS